MMKKKLPDIKRFGAVFLDDTSFGIDPNGHFTYSSRLKMQHLIIGLSNLLKNSLRVDHIRERLMVSPKCLLVILSVLLLLPSTSFADTILLKSDAWCPYNCAPDADLPGYAVEIAERIFKKAGHTLKYEIAPWSRALRLVKDGDSSAIIGVAKNEAPELIFPEQEIGISVIHFFKRKGTPWHYSGIASLRDVNIGIMADYEYGAELDEYFKKNKGTHRVQVIRSKRPLVLNIKKLLGGRIDVIPEDKAVFIETARSMGVLDSIEDAGVDPITSKVALDESFVYIAFSPKNPKSKEYARLISEGIEQLRTSGELETILAKYGLKDWREAYQDVIRKYQ